MGTERLCNGDDSDVLLPYIGAIVTCYGSVIHQREVVTHPTPETTLKRTQIVLGNVLIAGFKCDHICLLDCEELRGLQKGDYVSVIGYLKLYDSKRGQVKYGLKFPYSKVETWRREKKR